MSYVLAKDFYGIKEGTRLLTIVDKNIIIWGYLIVDDTGKRRYELPLRRVSEFIQKGIIKKKE